jgi:hypothetical protein
MPVLRRTPDILSCDFTGQRFSVDNFEVTYLLVTLLIFLLRVKLQDTEEYIRRLCNSRTVWIFRHPSFVFFSTAAPDDC